MDLTTDLEAENRRLKRAVTELSVLNEIATAIGTHQRVDQVNKLILAICIRHFEVEQGVIHLLDTVAPGDALKTGIRVRKPSPEPGSGSFRLGVTLSGWILLHKEPLASNDLANDSRFPGVSTEMPGVRSVLVVPLVAQNRMSGILSLFNKKNRAAWTDGDIRLLGMIGVQAASVIETVRLHEMEEDLMAARSIQRRLLPEAAPVMPALDLFGTAVPAQEVGGDFYDWLPLADGKLGCIVADVSGKGMPAALLMAQLQATFRAQVDVADQADRVVNEINRVFGRTLAPDRFVTLFYAVIDPVARQISYANAGHNPALLWTPAGEVRWLDQGGIILGRISSSTRYSAHSVDFQPGSGLLVYSDGVTEAQTRTGDQFGADGLAQSILAAPASSAAQVGTLIQSALEHHTGGVGQADDVTFAVIRFR
jgi:sigma-B regulation protein RsbU (phosphoserine phosphatase)